MKAAGYATLCCVLGGCVFASGQSGPGRQATPLSELLAEGLAQNASISAAQHAWKAAAQDATKVTTLPDARLTVQQLSVGSPRPFAGFTNSDFAYIGVGASQELPFPGKLRLRGEAARAGTESVHAQVAVKEAAVADAIKAEYIRLAYLQATLPVLGASKAELDTLIRDSTLRYEVGQGMQQDVLQAQLERTKLVREVAMHHERMAEAEARMKGLLRRDQGSSDIVAEPLRDSAPLKRDAVLLEMVRKQNAQVQADSRNVSAEEAKVAAARREGKPDFEVDYLYERTDPKYRDYYMLTVSMRLPRRKRVQAEVAQAAEMAAEARDLLDANLQAQMAEAKQQYEKAKSDEEILTDFRQGLVPQTEAAYRATVSAYGANREQFSRVVSSFLDLLKLRLDVLETVADRETALARLETLTGESLR